MKTTLFDCTGMGTENPSKYAASRLLFTKRTRLGLNATALKEIMKMSDSEINEELSYVAGTVPSSWEFVNYSWLIEGVSRVFTHQLVRTRTASYAQQSMRIIDMSNHDEWVTPGPSIQTPQQKEQFYIALLGIRQSYQALINLGAKVEDARDILPSAIQTNICVSMNLRAFIDLAKKRDTTRVQGEYRRVLHSMIDNVLDIHPWVVLFFDKIHNAASELDAAIVDLDIPEDKKTQLTKLLQVVRTN